MSIKRLLLRPASSLVLLAAISAAVSQPSSLQAGEPDLSDARVQALRVEFAGKREALGSQLATEIARIAADGLAQAQQMQAKAKISGNVTAMAAASAAVRIFTDAGTAIKQTGSFRFPDSIRPDLEAFIDISRKAMQASVERHASALRALEAEYAPRLGSLVAASEQAPDTKEEQLALLNKLAGAPAAKTTDAAASNTVPADAILIRSSREAQQWDTVLRGEIHVAALEILHIGVMGITTPRKNQGQGDESVLSYTVQLTPVRELTPVEPAPAFRVMSLPPYNPVDVLSFPTSENGWSLEVRARPSHGSSRLGFVLEVDAAANATRLLSGGQPAPAAGKPSGSVAPAVRPPATGGAAVTPAPPAPSPANTAYKVFHVPASGTAWMRTGIQVRKGTRIQTTILGTWSCSSGGEFVDAEGYPNSDRFFRYYIDPKLSPRITLEANYGALLARIQPEGASQAIGKQTAFTADKAGELAFDINEDPAARRDNKGTLEVRVITVP